MRHRRRLSRKRGQRHNVYRCRWHDDFRKGEGAWPHWHVGTSYKYGTQKESTP